MSIVSIVPSLSSSLSRVLSIPSPSVSVSRILTIPSPSISASSSSVRVSFSISPSVFTVTCTVLATLSFPDGSVCVIESVWFVPSSPPVKATEVEYAPKLQVVVVGSGVIFAFEIVTVASVSQVPLTVKVFAMIASPRRGELIAGALGAVISTSKSIVRTSPSFPLVSVRVSVMSSCVHSVRVERVSDQVPSSPTVVVPRIFESESLTVIVVPSSPVPVRVGEVSFVVYGAVVSPSRSPRVGASGAIVSTSIV